MIFFLKEANVNIFRYKKLSLFLPTSSHQTNKVDSYIESIGLIKISP